MFVCNMKPLHETANGTNRTGASAGGAVKWLRSPDKPTICHQDVNGDNGATVWSSSISGFK